MPNRRTHERVARQLLGQCNPSIHFLLDHPSTGELKSVHQVLFHDWQFINYIERKLGHEVAREALLHVIMDIEKFRPSKVIRYA